MRSPPCASCWRRAQFSFLLPATRRSTPPPLPVQRCPDKSCASTPWLTLLLSTSKRGSVQKLEQEKEPASGPAQQHAAVRQGSVGQYHADKSGRRPLHHELVQFDLAQAGNSLMPGVSVPPYTAAIIVFLQLPLNN
uniref:Uncharacterized protein n=1 Tax=Aegilops tauschii subsp. strangulata TaxID=200361 RepID=A0A453BI18_AEGTS